MQSVLRVGAISGVVGCVALYGLARMSGLVAAYGIIVLGVAVGLAMAKWLDWSWYGHQLEAGAQAGAIACIPAAALALVALLSQGARSVGALEASSHLGPVNAAGLAHAFGFASWVGADLLSVVFATLFAIGMAALTTIIMAWSKSGRAVRSVNQAYEAARSLRSSAWNPAGTTAIPAIQGATTAVPATNLWPSAHQPTSAPVQPSAVYGQVPPTPAQAGLHVGLQAGLQGVGLNAGMPSQDSSGNPPGSKPPANTPATDEELRAAMREALSMWGDESGEHEVPSPADSSAKNGTGPSARGEKPGEKPGEKRKRSPQASQFLNDAKKRGRKKADTRDWLC